MTDHMSRLPIELFTPIIVLSFDTPDSLRRLIRTEELRLVSKAWQTALDNTPLFWTFIPNEASASEQAIQRWIRKSGEAPLHVLCTRSIRPLEVFMPLVTNHTHRWRQVEINGQPEGSAISKYIKEPAPLLESLTLFSASLSSEEVVFDGITPSLSSVTLCNSAIPKDVDLTFLRDLREICLRQITYNHQTPSLAKLCDALSACPDLEKLEVDALYTTDPSMAERPPVRLAKLSSFSLQGLQNPPEITGAIFGMIRAPCLASIRLVFDECWAWPAMNILSPLSTELLLRHDKYRLFISDWRVSISVIDEEGKSLTSPKVFVGLSSSARRGGPALKILEDVEKAAPLSATVDIVISLFNATGRIFDYLKSTVSGIDGSLGHPLPQLRTLRLNARLQPNSIDTYKNMLSEFAHARQDVPKIQIKVWGGMGYDDIQILQLDRVSSSFVAS